MNSMHGGPSTTDGPPASPAPVPAAGARPIDARAADAGPADARATDARLNLREVDPRQFPVRADGVQLIGRTEGSGYREAPSLVRRADGQALQLTRLLYLILEAADGGYDVEAIAAQVGAASGRAVSADNVRTLIDTQLLPLGLLRLADGSQPEVRKADPLLGMRFRYTVTDPERTRRLTAPFAVLFNPLVVAAVTAAFLATCWWVLMVKGLASATHEAFTNPALVLLVLAVTVFSAGFHEFGHAAAARRGGATPGAMGAGLYLVWPAFYTDVTDSYRLGRGGRLRTDLGGLYFNAIVAVAVIGIWWATGFDALLLVVVTQLLQMVRQLLPLVRFDGYHILADAVGVPDLFQRIKPTLLSLLPWRRKDPQAQLLKPWARAVVTVWVLVTVPLLLFSLVIMVLALPRLLATAWSGVQRQYAMLGGSLADGNFPDAAVRVVAIAAVALPVLGILYILLRLGRQLVTGLWQKTRGHALRRVTATALAAAVLAGLGWAWWPDGETYRPVQPYERGTLADATAAIVPAASGTRIQEGRAHRTVALWPAGTRQPTRDDPQLSLVLVPRQSGATATGAGAGSGAGTGETPTAAPAWVFPFDRPAAAEDDGNQALAVNTTDGSVAYDVAFALVWADDGGDVRTRNEAYAFASCTGCTAAAVGFQVVLIVGQADVVVPENLAAAANYNCLQCVTYALAAQQVLTLNGPLSTEGTARLNALWQEIAEFGRNLQDVPLADIQGRLNAYKEQIVQLITADTSALPAAGTGTTQTAAPAPDSTLPASPDATDPTATTEPTATTGGNAPAGPAPATATPAPAGTTAPSATPTAPAPSDPVSLAATGQATATAPAAAPETASPTATATPQPTP